MLQVQEEEINARDKSINAINEVMKAFFERCKQFMEKAEQLMEKIKKIMPSFDFPKPSPEATLSEEIGIYSKDKFCYENTLKLAERGFAGPQLVIGIMYLTGSNPMNETDDKKAFEWFHKSAIHGGDSSVQFFVGICYFKGFFVDEDFEKAFYYFNRAAKNNYIKAQINLGQMYECGKHVAPNKEKALNWYMKAADKGDPIAQHACGMLHYEGINASPDLKAASMFLKKAADQDYEPSIAKINEMKKIGEYIEQNDQEHISID